MKKTADRINMKTNYLESPAVHISERMSKSCECARTRDVFWLNCLRMALDRYNESQ